MRRPNVQPTEPTRDTYWDPQLSRSNLAEPVFGDIAERTGLERLAGAGRVVMTVGGEHGVWRGLLAALREADGRKYLVVGNVEPPPKAPPLRKGQPVALSWFVADCWWGARIHVAQVMDTALVLQFPVTAYSFPVRDHLWSSVDTLGRLFQGFDVALESSEEGIVTNAPARILRYVNEALADARPALLYLGLADTIFPGRLALASDQGKPPLRRIPATIDFAVGGADLVGLGWRPGIRVVVSLLVGGDTVAFRSEIVGGQDLRVQLRFPTELNVRQRRRHPRVPVGAQRVIDFAVPLTSPLGVGAGVSRPFRIIDLSAGGVGLVFDARASEILDGNLPGAICSLYGKLKFRVNLEVVEQIPFGARHVRYCCAFRGLDPKQRRAIEVLCAKLDGRAQVGRVP